MKISSAKYLTSNKDYRLSPKPDKPEFAFIGRSNVGKSSLINLIFNNKKLAKISSSPGKTQLINHFIINEQWYVVDLPGYGYAKVSKSQRKNFYKIIQSYILNRLNLYCLFVLLDCRHEPLKLDIDFINWLGENEVPFAIVFTKIDKLSDRQLKNNIEQYKNRLLKDWLELPSVFLSSSIKNIGREEILKFIAEMINNQS